MLQSSQTGSLSRNQTGPLPVLTPAAFVDLDYSPALLLPVSFDSSICQGKEYRNACAYGFEHYFEGMCHPSADKDDFDFVERIYTLSEVLAFVLRCTEMDKQNLLLAFRAGFAVGWLSALALTDRKASLIGLQLLSSVVRHEYCSCCEHFVSREGVARC